MRLTQERDAWLLILIGVLYRTGLAADEETEENAKKYFGKVKTNFGEGNDLRAYLIALFTVHVDVVQTFRCSISLKHL